MKRLKNLKEKYENSASETELFEKFSDYVKVHSDSKGITADHIEAIKVKYFELKPLSLGKATNSKGSSKEPTLLINVKKFIADVANAPTTAAPITNI